ncbi:MAG: DUF1566 domain-containing protein [Nitrospinaceae bacterium]
MRFFVPANVPVAMSGRFQENPGGAVTDTRTGLMWQQGFAYQETGNYFTWFEANAYVARLNARRLGGHADWRMPHKLEIMSLYLMEQWIDFRGRRLRVRLDPAFEFGYGSSFWTWRERLSGALAFQFDAGEARWFPKASAAATVRAVRLEQNPFKLLVPGGGIIHGA